MIEKGTRIPDAVPSGSIVKLGSRTCLVVRHCDDPVATAEFVLVDINAGTILRLPGSNIWVHPGEEKVLSDPPVKVSFLPRPRVEEEPGK